MAAIVEEKWPPLSPDLTTLDFFLFRIREIGL
jgi:hypothetical protein